MNQDATALTGTAVQEVAELAERAAAVQRIECEGRQFTDREIVRVDTDPRLPKALEFYTLAGLLSYLQAEDFGEDRPLVHVVSPVRVEVVGGRIGRDGHLRRQYAVATCKSAVLQGFSFNQFHAMDTLHIALQTCFEADAGDIEELRKFCASVRSTAEVGVADDGVSQSVTAKAGVAAVVTTGVRNPWELAPWRTFAEITQPTSPFVLRFKQGDAPTGGLFETGDASWQPNAVAAIAKHLRAALGDGWAVLG